MKRMSVGNRKFWVDRWYGKYFRALTCEFGSWNRKKLLHELEKKLRKERMNNAT